MSFGCFGGYSLLIPPQRKGWGTDTATKRFTNDKFSLSDRIPLLGEIASPRGGPSGARPRPLGSQ